LAPLEVAEFWDCRDPGPLADGDHRRIFAAEPELGVLAHEASRAPKFGIDKLQ
jgi:hypothetical protein